MQVMTFWSHLIQRDVTSPLFFLPHKLGGLGVGSAVQRHAAAPWRALQSVIPTLMATTQSPDTDTLFHPGTTTASPTCSTSNHSLTTTEQASLPPQTTRFGPSAKRHSKKSGSPSSHGTFASSCLRVLSSSPNPRHTPEPTSCNPAVEPARLRTAVSALL